jgi:hypothetical protein
VSGGESRDGAAPSSDIRGKGGDGTRNIKTADCALLHVKARSYKIFPKISLNHVTMYIIHIYSSLRSEHLRYLLTQKEERDLETKIKTFTMINEIIHKTLWYGT